MYISPVYLCTHVLYIYWDKIMNGKYIYNAYSLCMILYWQEKHNTYDHWTRQYFQTILLHLITVLKISGYPSLFSQLKHWMEDTGKEKIYYSQWHERYCSISECSVNFLNISHHLTKSNTCVSSLFARSLIRDLIN